MRERRHVLFLVGLQALIIWAVASGHPLPSALQIVEAALVIASLVRLA